MTTIQKIFAGFTAIALAEVAFSNKSNTAGVLNAGSRFTTGVFSTVMGNSSGAVG